MNALTVERLLLRIGGGDLFAPLDLHVEPGTVTSVIGASGAGKSSLLAYIGGVLPAAFDATGRIRIGGEDLTERAPEERGFGILFQEALLFPHLDVAGNLLFGMRGGRDRAARRRRASDALASLGLDGYAHRDPATLSGGQKTRVALLRVLLSEPRALLLDEPFGALDDASRAHVRELVFAEAKRRRLPTLLVTHDQDDVTAAAGPVVRLTAA